MKQKKAKKTVISSEEAKVESNSEEEDSKEYAEFEFSWLQNLNKIMIWRF